METVACVDTNPRGTEPTAAPLSPAAYVMIGVALTVGLIGIGIGLFALWRWAYAGGDSGGQGDKMPLIYRSAATVRYSVSSQ
jgi:hypothetical protein